MVAIMRRALVLTVALLACCAPAQAATVTARQYEELTKVEEKVTVTHVEYRADPGEVNVVRLWIEGDRLRIADSGAPLRAVGLCDQIDAHEASCPRVGGIPISTGDGDDTVTTPLDDPDAPAARVFAGEGDDRLSGAGELHGGAGDDVITLGILTRHEGGSAQGSRGKGGEGDDTITGSDGQDALWGGGGRNTLLAGADDDYVFEGDTRGAGDWDVLDGGAGQDWLGYSGHDEDLFADLRSAGQQIIAVPTGALDDVRGFESLLTGSGADTIIGEGSDRAMYSTGPGDDLVRAGPGMDSMHMGKGNDRVLAAGDDLLKDYIDCGPGLTASSPRPATTPTSASTLTSTSRPGRSPACNERARGCARSSIAPAWSRTATASRTSTGVPAKGGGPSATGSGSSATPRRSPARRTPAADGRGSAGAPGARSTVKAGWRFGSSPCWRPATTRKERPITPSSST